MADLFDDDENVSQVDDSEESDSDEANDEEEDDKISWPSIIWTKAELEILRREHPTYRTRKSGTKRAWVKGYVIVLIKNLWRGRYNRSELEKDAKLATEWRKKKKVSIIRR